MALSLITDRPYLPAILDERKRLWRHQCYLTGVKAAALTPSIAAWRDFETYAALISSSGGADTLDLTALSKHQACLATLLVTLQRTSNVAHVWHRHLTACWKRDAGAIAVVGTPVVIADAGPGGLAGSGATITVTTNGSDAGRIEVVAGSVIYPIIVTVEVMFGTLPYDLAP